MKSICVYCGSSMGVSPHYQEAAQALGKEMAQQGIGLVYGGASVGIMGVIADTVLANDGNVVGVIPQSIVDMEVAHPGLSELHIVNDMHERKALMMERSEGFIAMPGGMGTLEELFEALTWSQLGFHTKPVAVLNIDNYYQHLMKFLDFTSEQGFVKPAHRTLLLNADDPSQLLDMMTNFTQPAFASKVSQAKV